MLRSDWVIIAGFGGVAYHGIPTPAILGIVEASGVKRSKVWKLYKQVKLIERGALTILNERK